MIATAFEQSIAEVFDRAQRGLADRLAVERARAQNLQAQDTRRVAFILTEAIEAELTPAVLKALGAYDEAINRPLTPNPSWEAALRKQISGAADSAVRQALALDRTDHPWKPLLSAESPKLSGRLLALADDHFAQLGRTAGRRRRKGGSAAEMAIRAGLFAAGLAVGVLLMKLLHA